MDIEEEAAKKIKSTFEIGQDLSSLSVEEIAEIVSLLQDEITRLNEMRSAKSAHLSAAEALFSKG